MVHSDVTTDSGERLGENIATKSHTLHVEFKGAEPVKLWYDEIKDYDYNSPGFAPETGHFTQVVWKESTQLGMGKAKTPDGKNVYAVGSYRAPGNKFGAYVENVPPLL
ncbi:Golgi-associated plant pathogenesis-related protein 1 [Elysia marginata]|uniref:Golgi-associated plant pathogenesis-related protein 1 n=1 Tax=Elysia marginata TaxID=1093978 RepID=A0AAV4F2C8_9GAST|nr:Golgi-associated plant pathogenesis-related protein 1 [Elysia marginata]